ncbi:hypothetical protein CLU83_0607 [Flavobacterium sp. 1]|nr:hypothetical protein CLU83_0607 [Flavobacterium sp. 1]
MTARGIAPNYQSNGNSPTALWKGANMRMLQEPLSIMGSCPDRLWQIDEVNKLQNVSLSYCFMTIVL